MLYLSLFLLADRKLIDLFSCPPLTTIGTVPIVPVTIINRTPIAGVGARLVRRIVVSADFLQLLELLVQCC